MTPHGRFPMVCPCIHIEELCSTLLGELFIALAALCHILLSSWCRIVFCAFSYSRSPSPSCTRCCALSCTHSGFLEHRPSCDKLNFKSISGEDNQNHQNYLFSNHCLLKRHCVLQFWAADLPLNKFSHKDTQLRADMRTNQF